LPPHLTYRTIVIAPCPVLTVSPAVVRSGRNQVYDS
jgi:hypothetical protein